HAVAQHEGPRGAVGARGVGLREVALDSAGGGETRQVVVEIDGAAPLVAKDAHDGVERAQVLVEGHGELAAWLDLAVRCAAEDAGEEESACAGGDEVTGEAASGHAHRSTALCAHGSPPELTPHTSSMHSM